MLGLFVVVACLSLLWVLLRRKVKEPQRWPAISVLKPLAGHDDGLEENLQSHLALDYPGEWEMLLGVRDESDLAYGLAKKLAEQHPSRVRLVLQEGDPGFSPKVNQLITLTRHAKHSIIVSTDSNIRVPKQHLREHAALLEDPKVGLTSNVFCGAGEETFGAAFDNLSLNGFVALTSAGAEVALGMTQVIGKSIALKREVLEKIGGWELVKDYAGEDQPLGRAVVAAGFNTRICPSPVLNVQMRHTVAHFIERQSRWTMIRFRVMLWGVFPELLYNCSLFSTFAWLSHPRSPVLLGWMFFMWGYSAFNQWASTKLMRGSGPKLKFLLAAPVRDYLFFYSWIRGALRRTITWRGVEYTMGAMSKLTPK